jgi:hypothetical protein
MVEAVLGGRLHAVGDVVLAASGSLHVVRIFLGLLEALDEGGGVFARQEGVFTYGE